MVNGSQFSQQPVISRFVWWALGGLLTLLVSLGVVRWTALDHVDQTQWEQIRRNENTGTMHATRLDHLEEAARQQKLFRERHYRWDWQHQHEPDVEAD